jgi:hypothetical protein
LLYEANLSDHSPGSRSDGSSNTSITERSNRRNRKNKSRKEKQQNKGPKWPGIEVAIQMVSTSSPDHQIPCVNPSYGRLIDSSNNIATIELPDNLMESVEEGLIKNPMIGQGEADGERPRNVRHSRGDRNNGNKNGIESEDVDVDVECNIEDEKDEDTDADADILGMQGIQGVPCQPPLSDELDMNYLSFSSSSSALHSGSSSYEQRGLRTNSRDDCSDDVLYSAEERNTDTGVNTETSSTKSGAVVLNI